MIHSVQKLVSSLFMKNLVRRRVQFTLNIELEIEKKSLVASQSDIVTARCFLSTRTELHLECLRLS